MDLHGRHHDCAQIFGTSLDPRRTPIEVRLCVCVEEVWTFDDYLMALSPKK